MYVPISKLFDISTRVQHREAAIKGLFLAWSGLLRKKILLSSENTKLEGEGLVTVRPEWSDH